MEFNLFMPSHHICELTKQSWRLGAAETGLASVQYYPCTGAVWALMANGDGGTGEAFVAGLKALQPTVEPLAAPSEKCTTIR
jgi:hypothetical protein